MSRIGLISTQEEMMTDASAAASATSQWAHKVSRYRTPSTLRACVELAITGIPFALAWYAAYVSLQLGYWWLYPPLLLVTVGFLVRLFLIQHDCGHHAFFASRSANNWTGRAIGVLTLTAYEHWRHAHSIHHATSGNLDSRGVGDIDTITVDEYQARTRWTQLRYRLYRHPSIMFGVGPFFIFVLQNRLPAGFMRAGWRPWVSTIGTDVAIGCVVALLIQLVGWRAFFAIQLPVMFLSATVGGWLFYVQHQFEHTYWEEGGKWNARSAALRGSSHYDLPGILRWFTANIGVHHVHHLSSRIPFYRLPDVLRDHPELRATGRLTLLQSFRCVRLTLWDKDQRRLISFRELRRRELAGVPA